MLHMNYTNNDLVEFYGKMDKEFETLENEIKSTLEIIDVDKKISRISNLMSERLLFNSYLGIK